MIPGSLWERLLQWAQLQSIPDTLRDVIDTASELNNDYFAVERSADGQAFAEIGRKEAAGNSSSPRSYEHWDDSPPARPELL
ncbi:hypothetical protein HC928_12845, partial [bacterium]|nr:hypothetical protein [bacterium]